MIDIFIPSYHRPENQKTVKYYLKQGYEPSKLHVFLDSEADDIELYKSILLPQGVNVFVFDMSEARRRYDYVHRASVSLRSAGQARNMMQDYAKDNGIDFYMVSDDDTDHYQMRVKGRYTRMAGLDDLLYYFRMVEDFMRRNRIGLFGLSQTGDLYSQEELKVIRWKVMNTTFYLMPYIYRGERGVQDDDTSLFTGVYNEGLFTGSLASGLVLKQTPSATAQGGLTDLYNECKLLNKSLVCPIQFPSAIWAEKQVMNGGRIHHHINKRYLAPCLIKGKRNNIPWDTYPEDTPFTNEPKRNFILREEERGDEVQ
jgi:hypothetical protein